MGEKASISVIRGNDGRVLGVTLEDGVVIDRDKFETWTDFSSAVASLAFSRIPTDCESKQAREMIAKDDARIKELHTKQDSPTW